MAAKKRVTRGAMNVSERVAYLLKMLWGENYSAMASDVGCSHTAIANVVRGRREPGRRLLEAISGHPKVNPAWLLTGAGEPIIAKPNSDSPAEFLLPVLEGSITTEVLAMPSRFAFEHLSVPSAHFASSRFWLKLSANDFVVQHADNRLIPGDLLLMETDKVAVLKSAQLDRRFGLIRKRDASVAKLGKFVIESGEPGSRDSLWFDDCESSSTFQSGYDIRIIGSGTPRVIRKTFRKGVAGGRARNIASSPQLVDVAKCDVLAVCQLILRRFE